MKQLSLYFFLLFSFTVKAQNFEITNPNAFRRGEELKYSISFTSALTGEIKAGTAQMIIKDENKKIANNSTYHFVLEGGTKGVINFFFKVKDRFDSYVDENTLLPFLFIRKTSENKHSANENIMFDRTKNQVLFTDNKRSKQKTFSVPKKIHDFISAYYYARTIDIKKIKKKSLFQMKFVFEDSIYTTDIYFEGKENKTTFLGTFDCLKFRPKVIIGNIFDKDFPLTVWITNDKNRLPLLIESDIAVGFIRIELLSYKNLENPLTSLIK